MLLVYFVEELGFIARLSKVIVRLCEENLVTMNPPLSLWCGSDSHSDKRSASDHLYVAQGHRLRGLPSSEGRTTLWTSRCEE